MSTSGSTDFNLTSAQIVEAAFNRIGVGSEGEALTARMAADGQLALNLLIKTWGAQQHLWTTTEGTLGMVAGQAGYTLGVTGPKPMRVLSVRRIVGGIDTPLNEMSRQEYFDQPNKTLSPSTPVSFYYDPQTTTGVLYLWPSPSAAVIAQPMTLALTYLRRMADMDASSNDLDMPQEWLEAVIYNVALRLMTQYPVNDPNIANDIRVMAAMLYRDLKGWDNEPASVFLQPDDRWGRYAWR